MLSDELAGNRVESGAGIGRAKLDGDPAVGANRQRDRGAPEVAGRMLVDRYAAANIGCFGVIPAESTGAGVDRLEAAQLFSLIAKRCYIAIGNRVAAAHLDG